MRSRLFIGIISLATLITSCSSDISFAEFQSIPQSGWKADSAVVFEAPITDSGHYHDVFIEFRLNGNYEFSNLYLTYEINGPKGQKIENRRNFVVARKDGKWLGKGMGDLQSYSFQVERDLVIRDTGEYKIKINQSMQRESLDGITDVGIKIKSKDEVI